MTDTRADWIDMRVPDGTNWLEYILNQSHPSSKTRGVMNHIALWVPDVKAACENLRDRGARFVRSESDAGGTDGAEARGDAVLFAHARQVNGQVNGH